MNDSQISVRYAKALFQSALEQELIDRVYSDMDLLLETCKIDEFRYALETPAISSEQKYNISAEIWKTRFSDLSLSLIKLVIKNRREIFLPGIARHFKLIYKKFKGIKTASLTTASTVDDRTRKKLEGLVRKALKAEIDLSASVDESVIGGFVLTIEDQCYDASVATSLKKIKKQLLETSVIKK